MSAAVPPKDVPAIVSGRDASSNVLRFKPGLKGMPGHFKYKSDFAEEESATELGSDSRQY